MRIVVVEPHPDDAFLSLGWHLETLWANDRRTILTVYADERRSKEASRYAHAIGATSICLGLEESRMDSDGKIEREERLDSVISRLGFDEIVFPIGLQHPDHLRVEASAEEHCWYYLDTPYQTKHKLQEDLLSAASGRKIVSICYPHSRKWRHIPIFQSQSKFFHFNRMQNLRIPEIVVED
jgi:hypothetical protein